MLQKLLALFLSFWLLFGPSVIYAAQTDQSAGQSAPPVVNQTPEQLQQLVAPIAVYPDALVSQILAAATYPTEIVEADRWVSRSDSSPASVGDGMVGDGMAGDAIGATGRLFTTTTHLFPTARASIADMKGIKDSTTLELAADMKAPTVSKVGAEMKGRVVGTSAATDFTAAWQNVGLQSRTPKPARIAAPLVGTTMAAPRAATRIGVGRACTAAAVFTKQVAFTAEASAIDCVSSDFSIAVYTERES